MGRNYGYIKEFKWQRSFAIYISNCCDGHHSFLHGNLRCKSVKDDTDVSMASVCIENFLYLIAEMGADTGKVQIITNQITNHSQIIMPNKAAIL